MDFQREIRSKRVHRNKSSFSTRQKIQVQFEMVNSKINGNKLTVDLHGNVFQGEYINGQLNGESMWFTPDGFTIKAIFKNGLIDQLIEVRDFEGNTKPAKLVSKNSTGTGLFVTHDLKIFEVITKTL